jgi:hypothetical protein
VIELTVSGNLQRSVQSNSYADYNAMIRDAQPTYVPEPANATQMPPSQGLRQQVRGGLSYF